MKKTSLVSLIVIIIDQLIKALVKKNFILNQVNVIIKNFFCLTYVQNEGAAWSLFNGSRYFLIVVACLSIFLIYKFFIKDTKLNKFQTLTYGILLGGIIGNLLDRMVYGYVIDYLDFYIFNYNFPIFNLADICIVISVVLIFIAVLRGEKNESSRK